MARYKHLLKTLSKMVVASLTLSIIFLLSQSADESVKNLAHNEKHLPAENIEDGDPKDIHLHAKKIEDGDPKDIHLHAKNMEDGDPNNIQVRAEERLNPPGDNIVNIHLDQSHNPETNSVRIKTNYTSLYHIYDDQVDLRIIVMTYNRPTSLNKTLHSLQGFITEGLHVSLEIWIDKGVNSTEVDKKTLQVARDFRWSNGPATVWIHTRHVGLFGQWLYTWRPLDMSEWALFVEDDVDVSKYGYKWLRAVHAKYRARDDIACYTLQDENAIGSRGRYRNKEIKKPSKSPVFFHRLPGSWALAPHPLKWRQFQNWYEISKQDSDFRPYVKAARIQTEWYKVFEEQKRQDTMWTMWYIYYTSTRNQICAYANLPTYTGQRGKSMSSNRKEPGLHYNAKLVAKDYEAPHLLDSWNDSYVRFPDKPPVYDFDGKVFKPKSKRT